MKSLITAVLVAGVALWTMVEAGATLGAGTDVALPEQGTPPEPLVIVVNRMNPVDDLSFADLRSIFLGSRSYWNNGKRITVVMREPGEQERRVILHDVCGMDEEQFKTHFLRGLYTGEILVSPKTLDTPVGVRKFIFNVPGAIGYLRESDVDPTVKVVRVDERLPWDKGYRLRVP
jgi:hypothetical protein